MMSLRRILDSYSDVRTPPSAVAAAQVSGTGLDPMPFMDSFTAGYRRLGLWRALAAALRRQLLQYVGLGLVVVTVGTLLPILLQRTLDQRLSGLASREQVYADPPTGFAAGARAPGSAIAVDERARNQHVIRHR